MTTSSSTPDVRISWTTHDARRLAQDSADIAQHWPQLQWNGDGAGSWEGELPLWPFERPAPAGLDALTGGAGLEVNVEYSEAYPMVPPTIWPLAPCPDVADWTLHTWHVNGDGSLCLLQSVSAWDPTTPIGELLLKAAGWRIEYAAMKAGVVDSMTSHGIVSDSGLDDLLADAARRLSETA